MISLQKVARNGVFAVATTSGILMLVISLFMRQYVLLNLLFSICFAIAFVFIYKEYKDNRATHYGKFITILMIGIVLSMAPFFHNGFLYGDDLWGMGKEYAPEYTNLNGSIAMRRPFNGVLFSWLSIVSFDSSWIARICSVVFLMLSAYLMFQFVHKHHDHKVAFVFTILFTCGTAMIDSIAYLSVNTVVYALFLSIVSYILFDYGYEKKKYVFFILSAYLLLGAFCLYQITTPIVFVMFMISLNKTKQKDVNCFKKAFLFLVWYGIVAVGYLLFTSLIMNIYHVEATQTARAQFVSTIPAIIGKLEWFFQTVIPQTCYKMLSIILGHELFSTNILFYEVGFDLQNMGLYILPIVMSLIIIYFVRLLVQKRFYSVFIGLCAIFLSFYPFLILPESYPLSYYMLPIIALFIYYSVAGFMVVFEILASLAQKVSERMLFYGRNAFYTFAGVLCCLCILNASAYANIWVNYCQDSHYYIKQNIASQIKPTTTRICVEGRISPYVGGNPYVIYSTQLALEELGYDPSEYQIMQVDNAYYIIEMTEREMQHLKEVLSSDDYVRLNQYYLYDQMYNRYLYNYSATSEDKEFIQRCLVMADLIFFESNETDIFVDLYGFNITHAF